MSQPQEVILYRSPFEHQLWNALSGDGGVLFVIIIISAFVAVAAMHVAEAPVDRLMFRFKRRRANNSNPLLVVGAVVFFGVGYFLASSINLI